MRGCPVSGWMHHYDPKTHRCRCGRWERGFKPKLEPVRPRDECQICERVQAIDVSGNMVHHGYERPGIGFIQGDCFGVSHKPYPAIDALLKYLKLIESRIETLTHQLEILPTVSQLSYDYTVGYGKNLEEIVVNVDRGDDEKFVFEHKVTIPSFEELQRRQTTRLTSSIKNLQGEWSRVRARIEKTQEHE